MKQLLIAAATALALVLALPTAALAVAPSNDDRADATVASPLPFSDSVVVDDATSEVGEPTNCNGRTRSVWYRHKATVTGRLVASTRGSNYDTGITVYEGSLSSMSFAACDEGATDEQGDPVLAFDVEEDSTYFIQVVDTGFDSSRLEPRNLEFHLRRQPTVDVRVDQRAWARTSDDRGTVTGTANCSAPVSVRLDVSLYQNAPGGSVGRENDGYLTCDGPMRWQVNLAENDSNDFVNGPAEVSVEVSVPTESMYSSFERDVKLRTCTVLGTISSDTLEGTSGKDRVCGLAGDDTITTGAGHDKVYSGPGNDTVWTGTGDDFVYGDEGADEIRTGRGDDEVEAGSGPDEVRTASGDDVVRLQKGADTVNSGNGDDRVRGGSGGDLIRLGDDKDVAHGQDGKDRIRGQSGRDSLFGEARPDDFDGGKGTDSCTGGSGKDSFESCETKQQ